MVRTLCFHCWGSCSIPGWGTKIPRAAWCSQNIIIKRQRDRERERKKGREGGSEGRKEGRRGERRSTILGQNALSDSKGSEE